MRTVRTCPGSHRRGSATSKSWCAPRSIPPTLLSKRLSKSRATGLDSAAKQKQKHASSKG